MKYIVIIPDGAADKPVESREGKTIFELAATPTMDLMAREGRLGLAKTVPDGCTPGSDVANLSLLGYDPAKELTGRAALEAASMKVDVPEGDAVFRTNFVTVSDEGEMLDSNAGHISSEEGRQLIELLNRDVTTEGVKFFPGVGYRHLCLMENAASGIPDRSPPHEIIGENVGDHMPQGQFSSWVLEVEHAAEEILGAAEVNMLRAGEDKNPANRIWLWGGATAMKLDNFAARHGLRSAGLISAVDLMRGLGTLAGMDILTVEGATAYLDTNYAGKGRAALDYIYDHDFVCVHVEAPDEAGHNGDIDGKIRALEDIDKHIVAPLHAMAKYYGDWRILLAPDHPTPVSSGKHGAEPVPYVLWGAGFEGGGAKAFSEAEAERVGGDVVDASSLMGELMRHD